MRKVIVAMTLWLLVLSSCLQKTPELEVDWSKAWLDAMLYLQI